MKEIKHQQVEQVLARIKKEFKRVFPQDSQQSTARVKRLRFDSTLISKTIGEPYDQSRFYQVLTALKNSGAIVDFESWPDKVGVMFQVGGEVKISGKVTLEEQAIALLRFMTDEIHTNTPRMNSQDVKRHSLWLHKLPLERVLKTPYNKTYAYALLDYIERFGYLEGFTVGSEGATVVINLERFQPTLHEELCRSLNTSTKTWAKPVVKGMTAKDLAAKAGPVGAPVARENQAVVARRKAVQNLTKHRARTMDWVAFVQAKENE